MKYWNWPVHALYLSSDREIGQIRWDSALTVYNKIYAGEPEAAIEKYCLTNMRLKKRRGCCARVSACAWAHIFNTLCSSLFISVWVCLSVCVCVHYGTAHGKETPVCVCVLLEMCHVCDKLTLIRQSHHALEVCLWAHMSDVATGTVMTQSNQSWVLRCMHRHKHTHRKIRCPYQTTILQRKQIFFFFFLKRRTKTQEEPCWNYNEFLKLHPEYINCKLSMTPALHLSLSFGLAKS